MTNINRLVKKAFSKVEKIPEKQSGFLGRADGTVRVPGKRNWVYVRVWNGNILEAYNQNVPANFGLAVDVIYRDGRYFVQARQVYNEMVNTSMPDGIADELQWPNTHTLYVRPEQILPGLVYPKSGMVVYLFGGIYPLPGGGYVAIPSQEIDLTSHIPASGAEWAVLSLEADGTVGVLTGGAAANWQLLKLDEIPEVPGFAVAAIRLFAGQTSIQHGKFGSVIQDLRFFQAGAGGGGGSIFVEVDLTDQIDGTETEFDVGEGVVVVQNVFWNGVRQLSPGDYSFTAPTLTTVFIPQVGDNLVVTVGEPTGGAMAWGSLVGSLSAQSDLWAALNGKMANPPDFLTFRGRKAAAWAALSWGDITQGSVSSQPDLWEILEDKLEAVNWGDIGGTLANQSDLNTALGGKIGDAASDGKLYGRKNAAWTQLRDESFSPPSAASMSLDSGDASFPTLGNATQGLTFNPNTLVDTDILRTAFQTISPVSGTWELTAHLKINMSNLDDMGFGLYLKPASPSYPYGLALLVTSGWVIKVRKFAGTYGLDTSSGDLYSQAHMISDLWLQILWDNTNTVFKLAPTEAIGIAGTAHSTLISVAHADWFTAMPSQAGLCFWSNRTTGKAEMVCDYFNLEKIA